MLKRFTKIAALVVGLTTLVTAAEKKFDMFGFMDATMSRLVVDDNNPLFTEGFDNAWRFRVGNVQLYTEFKPNPNIRALIETGFHWQPHGEYTPGQIVQVKNGDIVVNKFINKEAVNNVNTVNLTTRGEIPVSMVALHRSWLEYQFSQYVNIRAGKFITPAGIWNVDHGSPVIVTVRQPFQTGMIEVFPKSQTGLMAHGSTYLGDYDLDYKVYLTSGRDVQTIDDAKDIAAGGNLKFKALDVGLEVGFSAYTGIEKEEYRYAVVNSFLVLDSNGLPIIENGIPKTTLYNKDGVMEITDSTIFSTKSREHCIGLDAKWNYKGVLVQGEFNFNKLKNQLEANAETKVTAFYGLTGYKFRVNPKFSVMPYFLFEKIIGDNAYNRTTGKAVNPVNIISTGFVDELGTISGGVNMNIFTNTYLKLEYAWLNFDKDGATDIQNDAQDFGAISAQVSVAF